MSTVGVFSNTGNSLPGASSGSVQRPSRMSRTTLAIASALIGPPVGADDLAHHPLDERLGAIGAAMGDHPVAALGVLPEIAAVLRPFVRRTLVGDEQGVDLLAVDVEAHGQHEVVSSVWLVMPRV